MSAAADQILAGLVADARQSAKERARHDPHVANAYMAARGHVDGLHAMPQNWRGVVELTWATEYTRAANAKALREDPLADDTKAAGVAGLEEYYRSGPVPGPVLHRKASAWVIDNNHTQQIHRTTMGYIDGFRSGQTKQREERAANRAAIRSLGANIHASEPDLDDKGIQQAATQFVGAWDTPLSSREARVMHSTFVEGYVGHRAGDAEPTATELALGLAGIRGDDEKDLAADMTAMLVRAWTGMDTAAIDPVTKGQILSELRKADERLRMACRLLDGALSPGVQIPPTGASATGLHSVAPKALTRPQDADTEDEDNTNHPASTRTCDICASAEVEVDHNGGTSGLLVYCWSCERRVESTRLYPS